MRNKRKISGFSMAEILVVVAIIAVLGAVSAVGVQTYQRSLGQLELDSYAKELFIAAQNHLTMAEGQGLLGENVDYGSSEPASSTPDDGSTTTTVAAIPQEIHYIVVNNGAQENVATGKVSIFNLMLPFASIDETVRAGGSYIIRYQKNPAIVLDVFYCERSGRYAHTLSSSDYSKAMGLKGDGNKSARKRVSDWNGAVLGWYGGEGETIYGIDSSATLEAPVIKVHNEERLWVEVTDPNLANTNASLKLILTGESSEAQAAISLRVLSGNTTLNLPVTYATRVQYKEDPSGYTVVLDDITAPKLHFADFVTDSDVGLEKSADKEFIPGENIKVKAVAYSNLVLANIAESSEVTTNSLFADGTQVDLNTLSITGKIDNFRHLENLGYNVSNVGSNPNDTTKNIISISAEQTQDLDWTGFKQAIDSTWTTDSSETVSVFEYNETAASTTAGSYVPIEGDLALTYNGVGHGIANVLVNTGDAAGLFGAPTAALAVSNLELLDFSVTSTGGNAGALAGTLPSGSAVTNVVAHHSKGETAAATNAIAAEKKITGTASVGGLIGSMADGTVSECAAALYVQGGTNAGGLIGTATTGTVTACYAGGHTINGAYSDNTAIVDAGAKGLVNVIVADEGNAGGLIGKAEGGTVNACYSTCSTGGTPALFGVEHSVDVSNVYYPIAGDYRFAEGVSEKPDTPSAIMPVPYDTTLNEAPYPFYTMAQLCEKSGVTLTTASAHLSSHYGDWQEVAHTGLEVDNGDKLTVKVSVPEAEVGNSVTISMLVRGATSGEEAYLVFDVTKKTEGTGYDVALKDPLTIIPLRHAVEGVSEASSVTALSDWLSNAGCGVATVASAEDPLIQQVQLSLSFDSIESRAGHFANLFPTFVAGEDIVIVAEGATMPISRLHTLVLYDTTDESKRKLTNSLFADPNTSDNADPLNGSDVGNGLAAIKSFRHLENLAPGISRLGKDDTTEQKLTISKATQMNNLLWSSADSTVETYWDKTSVVDLNGKYSNDEVGYYMPVSVDYALEYNGMGYDANEDAVIAHSITGLKVYWDDDAGLFGTVGSACTISNLKLVNPSVSTTSGNAGALAGTLNNESIAVTNVLACNDSGAILTMVSAPVNVGGLIGSMTGGTVNKCAAALYVKSSGGDAGGLIGKAESATISASYSGGHTSSAQYLTSVDLKDPAHVNVIAAAKAGGLIGDAGSASVTNSYSTCSVSGATAGGFVGTASGGSISNCYATGLVSGTTAKGAFAGTNSLNATNCHYYEIINESRTDGSTTWMTALADDTTSEQITAFDASVSGYSTFVGAESDWRAAEAYDNTLNTNYNGKYCLGALTQLGGSVAATDFVATHHGDWPAPEVFVINE